MSRTGRRRAGAAPCGGPCGPEGCHSPDCHVDRETAEPEATRSDRLAELDRELRHRAPTEGEGRGPLAEPERYALIERSRIDGSWYLTTHASPRDAERYSACQEYVEDWEPERLVDLDTGEPAELVRTYGFRAEPGTWLHATWLDDGAAIDAFNRALSTPEWSVSMLEDLDAILRRTGRSPVAGAAWERH